MLQSPAVRMIFSATCYRHLITPKGVCLLLPWAFATLQISLQPSLPLFSSVAFGFQAEASISHFSKLECCCGLFCEALPAGAWCSSVWRGVGPKKSLHFQHLRASRHWSVSLCISMSNSSVRKLTLSELEVKCYFWCGMFF